MHPFSLNHRNPIVGLLILGFLFWFLFRRRTPVLHRRAGQVRARLRPKLIRYIVSQKQSRLDLGSVMNQGKIFLAKLSQGAIGEETAELYVGWDNTKKRYDPSRRVALVTGNYVVIIQMWGKPLSGVFVTAFSPKAYVISLIKSSPKASTQK